MMDTSPPTGFPVVIAAPSGAGKTTVARALASDAQDVVFSVSATTRPPRPGEVDGRDYRFVDPTEFVRMRDAGELIEWAEVHGHLYGTPAASVRAATGEGRHVVLDIDVQGARQIRAALPEAVLVFLLPPSGRVLRSRLESRGTERPEQVATRLRAAAREIDEAPTFDYVVVNDTVDMAVRRIRAILDAEGCRVRGRPGGAAMARIERLRAEVSDLADG